MRSLSEFVACGVSPWRCYSIYEERKPFNLHDDPAIKKGGCVEVLYPVTQPHLVSAHLGNHSMSNPYLLLSLVFDNF